ncbi:extracellular solute-binding protein [Candidatus Sumerlaeota bacterium]|nr:extracellular solute-binding protein [Candidatus Sumerlaeota bacterium]
MTRLKFGFFIGALIIGASGLGCGGSDRAVDSGDGRTHLEVWSWNVAGNCLLDANEDFKKEYPEIDSELIITSTMVQQRLMLSLISGVGAPDVTQYEAVDAPRYNISGRMLDLTEWAMKYKDDFSQAYWINCEYEGKVYAIPWDMGPCGVFYKRNIFEQYEIDPDAIDTWADYLAAGEKIYQLSNGKTKLMAASPGGMGWYFEILLQQAEGNVFDDQGRIALDSPATRKALDVLKTWLESDCIASVDVFGPEYMSSFKNDKIACYPLAVWLGSNIKGYAPETSGNWGVFRLPAIEPGGLRVAILGGSVLTIPAQTKHKEAAWKFVEFMMCNKTTQLNHYRNHDLFPALITTFDDPFFDEEDPFYANQKVRRLFATEIDKIHRLNRTKDWREANRYLGQNLSAWATTHRDNERFIKDTVAQMHSNLERELAPKAGKEAPIHE